MPPLGIFFGVFEFFLMPAVAQRSIHAEGLLEILWVARSTPALDVALSCDNVLTMPHDVFISHAAEDRRVAEAICKALEEQGVRCWIAPRDVVPGLQYAEAIVDAISTSRLVVLVLSSHAIVSAHVPREVERAAAKGVPFVTFRVDNALLTPSMEYFLSQAQWLDATAGRVEGHISRLSQAVTLLLRPNLAAGRAVAPPLLKEHERAVPAENLLHGIWDCLDSHLQDAFSLAYNKKRREGSTRISTRDFFQALLRIQDDSLRRLLDSLPQQALPEPVDASVVTSPELLDEDPLLSDCVADSLGHFKELEHLPRRIAPADIFVDVVKHGHGSSVARLRKHGVGPAEIDAQVRKLGLSVIRRKEAGKET